MLIQGFINVMLSELKARRFSMKHARATELVNEEARITAWYKKILAVEWVAVTLMASWLSYLFIEMI